MHHNPDYAKMFRGRPARYVLPMYADENGGDSTLNLVKLEKTKAKAFYISKGDIMVIPERLSNLGCETPRINYENFLGNRTSLIIFSKQVEI